MGELVIKIDDIYIYNIIIYITIYIISNSYKKRNSDECLC